MKELVVKSNELIEGHYNLSAVSQKLSAAVISLVNPKDTENPLPEFTFTIRECASLLGVSEQRVRLVIDNVTLELKQVVITLRKRDSHSYRRVGLFNYCEYDDEQKTVSFKFESALDMYIRDFASNFTQYQLEQIKQLKSKYAIRLYEILRKAHPISTQRQYSSYQVELDELKNMLGLKPEAYKGRYDRLRVSVIEVSQRELREKTDIVFDFEQIRKGRKVQTIKFTVSHNPLFCKGGKSHRSDDLSPIALNQIDPGMVANLRFQLPEITDAQLGMIASAYSRETILEALFDLMRATTSGSITGTPLNYYLGILKNKRREEDRTTMPASGKTTAEKLTDRSWADDF